jgi:acetyltransferase-like isoleucine patch superfamily enzyme
MIIGAQPAIVWFWFYWQIFDGFSTLFFLVFPFAFIIAVILLIITSLIVAKFFLVLVNIFHRPREGKFEREKSNKDYRYWSLRAVIKKWPCWVARQLSIAPLEIIVLKVFGVRIGKGVSLHEGWVDTEFIDIGDNCRLGQGSLIMSSIITHDYLIIRKVVLKNNIIIGAHSVIFPGTKIDSNTILDSNSTTKVNQHLRGDSIYRGSPSQKVLNNNPIKNKEKLTKKIFISPCVEKIENDILKEESKDMSVPFHLYLISGWIIIGFSFIIPGFLFFIYFFGILEPYFLSLPIQINSFLNIYSIIIMLSIPVAFIIMYLFHLFLVALFTRWFFHYAKKRGPGEGIYDRNLDEESKALDIYHFKSFLYKYPIFAFIRSPFPWLITWELRFIGGNKIGKDSVIEECYLHCLINLGKKCYLGTYTHLSNHLVDGVYGTENLTYFGVNLKDNVVFEALTGGLPGTLVGDDSTVLPIGATIKFDELEGDGVYSGFPLKKLDKAEKKDILGEKK